MEYLNKQADRIKEEKSRLHIMELFCKIIKQMDLPPLLQDETMLVIAKIYKAKAKNVPDIWYQFVADNDLYKCDKVDCCQMQFLMLLWNYK